MRRSPSRERAQTKRRAISVVSVALVWSGAEFPRKKHPKKDSTRARDGANPPPHEQRG